MKKILTIMAVALASMGIAHAQLGVIGGFTSSKTSLDSEDLIANAKNVSLYHVGAAYRVNCGGGIVVQPALTYQVKGAALNEIVTSSNLGSLETKTGFLEFSTGLQLGLDLLVFRPFVLFEPFVGYALTGSETLSVATPADETRISMEDINKSLNDAKNRLEYGFGVGGGVELMNHLQITVQWFMNLGQLYNDDKLDGEVILSAVRTAGVNDIKNYQGIKVSAAIFF